MARRAQRRLGRGSHCLHGTCERIRVPLTHKATGRESRTYEVQRTHCDAFRLQLFEGLRSGGATIYNAPNGDVSFFIVDSEKQLAADAEEAGLAVKHSAAIVNVCGSSLELMHPQ